ncbi:MAG: aspartyl protease family protein [Bacteroidetes bacterium]|nr:aspartyl protease family protein [Bacteroidota bacterium]
MRYCLIILGFFILPVCSRGQEILSPQPEAEYITSFPFKQYSGGVMVLKACFGNLKDSLNFILDTGSGGISLDSSVCAELEIPTVQTDTIITGIAGMRRVHFVFDKSLKLPGLTTDHLNFHVNDYSILTSVYGEKIDGIIGYSFFSRYIVNVDFDSLRIDVYKPGRFDYPRGGTILHPMFTSLPIQFMQVKDRKKFPFNFYLDTGAGLCFLMSERFVADSAVLKKKRKPLITQAEGMGGMLKMRLTVIKDVKIGPYHFRMVPTYLYDDENNLTSYPFTGGLMGNDILRRFNIVFNYPQREIHLRPNSHFEDLFDYAYTGLGIYAIDNKVVVVDVIEKSPAEKAGFQAGDELVSVGNNLSGNIQQYKNLLQTPNTSFKVIVRRKARLMELNLHVKSIL